MVTPCDRLRACRYYVASGYATGSSESRRMRFCRILYELRCAISDTYAEGDGDYPSLCRYNVAPGNAIGGSIFGVRSRGGLGSFTSTFDDTYVGGMMLLWPHRAGVCVPAGRKSYPPLSGNASCGRAIGREITKAGERVRVYFAPSDILMPASCGDY
jgi:hypothetical protein